MRNVIMLAILAAGLPAVAQQTSPCQLEERTLARSQALAKASVIPQQQLETAQSALAECQARQARLAAVKAQESALQAQLNELRKRFTDSHPDVVANGAKLAELHAQEQALTQQLRRFVDTQASLKQPSGGLQTGLPDRWWKNPATAQSLGLTAEQQRRMDDVFQQYRLKL